MGTFLGQGLKARQGESHWLRFFELVSSAFAPIEKRLDYWDGMDSTLKVFVSPFVTLKFNWVSLINYADSRCSKRDKRHEASLAQVLLSPRDFEFTSKFGRDISI